MGRRRIVRDHGSASGPSVSALSPRCLQPRGDLVPRSVVLELPTRTITDVRYRSRNIRRLGRRCKQSRGNGMTGQNPGPHHVPRAMPGLRTMRSRHFRIVLALLLIVFGSYMLVRFPGLLADVGFKGGHDLKAYLVASQKLLAGATPYEAGRLAESSHAVCMSCYLYPPFIAQVLSPLAVLPEPIASAIWYTIQLVSMYTAVWLGTGLGGARRSVERALWCLVAVMWFFPVFASLWYANISTVIALGVVLTALGGTVAGVSAAAMLFVKVAPGVVAPAVFMMSQESRRALLVGLVAFFGISFIFAQAAWLDYPHVLFELASYSPGQRCTGRRLAQASFPEPVVLASGAGSLVVAGFALLASMILARRPDGAPEAVLMGVIAMLLVPGTLYYHYLVVLLPIAAIVWPSARNTNWLSLLISAAIITIGFGVEWIALVGATLMVLTEIVALWALTGVRGAPGTPSSPCLTGIGDAASSGRPSTRTAELTVSAGMLGPDER